MTVSSSEDAPGLVSPEFALDALRGKVRYWRAEGVTEFTARDLYKVAERLGRSRGWIYMALAKLEAEGLVERAGTPPGWVIVGEG